MQFDRIHKFAGELVVGEACVNPNSLFVICLLINFMVYCLIRRPVQPVQLAQTFHCKIRLWNAPVVDHSKCTHKLFLLAWIWLALNGFEWLWMAYESWANFTNQKLHKISFLNYFSKLFPSLSLSSRILQLDTIAVRTSFGRFSPARSL